MGQWGMFLKCCSRISRTRSEHVTQFSCHCERHQFSGVTERSAYRSTLVHCSTEVCHIIIVIEGATNLA
jgi:hypothetical protein